MRESEAVWILQELRVLREHLRKDSGEEAATLTARLDALFPSEMETEPPEEELVDELLRLVRAHPAARVWLDQRLAAAPTRAAPPARGAEAGYDQVSVTGPILAPDIFVCPVGDYTWARRVVGQRVPRCPKHGMALIIDD